MFDDVCALLTSMLGELSSQDGKPDSTFRYTYWSSPGDYFSSETCTLMLQGGLVSLFIKMDSAKLNDRQIRALIRQINKEADRDATPSNAEVTASLDRGRKHITIKHQEADTGCLCDLLRVVMPFHEQYRIVEQGRWERRALAHARSMHPRLSSKLGGARKGLGLVRLL